MNTAGAVGTDGAWQIIFKPWGPSCWAAQRGSHSHSPPAPPTALAAPGARVGRGHLPVTSCCFPLGWQAAQSTPGEAHSWGVCGAGGECRDSGGAEGLGLCD